MAGPLADVWRHAPSGRYILVRRADDPQSNAGLRQELLRLDKPPPPRLRLLWDLRLQRGGEPALRLYEVLPATSP
jgi:hypothetical protein